MTERKQPNGAARRRLKDGGGDDLVREEPLVLEIDGERLLTMRTPGQDEDFAIGFLRSEGLIKARSEIVSLDFQKGIPLDEPGPGPGGEGLVADRIRIALVAGTEHTPRREALRRTHEIRPSCGLCGVEDLATLMPEGHLAAAAPKLTATTLHQILTDFHGRQSLFHDTGGCHGAAIATTGGAIVGFGEDVGRHNALDKAIGAAVRSDTDFANSVGILSGRAGYELIAKLLRVSCPIIVSVSAASALAFDLCREAGATLIGFARDGKQKVYWDEARMK